MYNRERLLAIVIAIVVFIAKERVGMSIIASLLTILYLREHSHLNKEASKHIIFALILFFIGHKLSLHIALSSIAPMGDFAWTFTGGFIGGVIELETYLIFTFLPMKSILSKDIISSLKSSLIISVRCFIIAGFVQGSYMAGWQNIFHI